MDDSYWTAMNNNWKWFWVDKKDNRKIWKDAQQQQIYRKNKIGHSPIFVLLFSCSVFLGNPNQQKQWFHSTKQMSLNETTKKEKDIWRHLQIKKWDGGFCFKNIQRDWIKVIGLYWIVPLVHSKPQPSYQVETPVYEDVTVITPMKKVWWKRKLISLSFPVSRGW